MKLFNENGKKNKKFKEMTKEHIENKEFDKSLLLEEENEEIESNSNDINNFEEEEKNVLK